MLCGSGENGFVPRLGNRAENVKHQVEGWEGNAFLAPDYCLRNEPFAGATGSIGPETSHPPIGLGEHAERRYQATLTRL